MPLLSQLSDIGLAKEAINPTVGGTINQTPATVTVTSGSIASMPTSGTFPIQVGTTITTVTYTGTTATTFTGCTVATGSVAYTTTSLIFVQGVAQVPAVYIPVTGIQVEDLPELIRDESWANNPTKLRGVYKGVSDATAGFDGHLFAEHVAYFLIGLGFLDTVSGAGPFVHTLKVVSPQPPTFTITEFDVFESRAWPGMILDQLDIKIDSKGHVDYQSKWKGWPSVTAATGAAVFPATAPFLAYETSATIAGVASTRVLSCSLSFKRSSQAIHTLQNSVNPKTMWAGPIEVDGKLVTLFEDNTELNHLTTNDQPQVALTITQPGGGNNPVLVLNWQKTGFMKAMRDRGKEFLQVSSDLSGIFNATDGGPFSATLSNGVSTVY